MYHISKVVPYHFLDSIWKRLIYIDICTADDKVTVNCGETQDTRCTSPMCFYAKCDVSKLTDYLTEKTNYLIRMAKQTHLFSTEQNKLNRWQFCNNRIHNQTL